MKNKLFTSLFSLLFLLFGVVGCSRNVTSIDYHNPSWLPNGKIICTKYVGVDSEPDIIGAISEISKNYYITTMNDDGSDEENVKEVDSSCLDGEIAVSPDGNYIAIAVDTSIRIFNSDFSDYSMITPEGNSIIEHLDFSPTSEGYKIVYTNYNKELHLTDIAGSFNNLLATSAETVAWRVGDRIVFEELINGLYTYLATINSSGDTKNTLTISGLYPQNMKNQFVMYRGVGTSVQKYSFPSSLETTVINDFSQTTLKLSFDDTKIVGGKLLNGYIQNIYVTPLSTGVTTRIK